MFNRYLTYYKTSVQILIFFLLIILSFAFAFLVDILLVPVLTEGLSYEEFSKTENYLVPEYVSAHRIIQFLTQVLVFILPALLFAYLAFDKPAQYLKLKTELNWKHLLAGLLIMGLSIPFIGLLEHFNKMIPITAGMEYIEYTAKLVTEAFLNTESPSAIALNVVIFVVAAAIGEELLFRGVFQNVLLSSNTFKSKPFIAIAIAALFFSLFHGQMSGVIPRFYAGFIIGVAYYFSNTIWVPIAMHALNNGMVLLAFYVSKANYDDAIGTLDYKDLLEIVPLTLISLFLLYKFYQKRKEYIIDKVPIDSDETNFLANF
jgi:membrane protease YdiL (CAAX protease family)